MAGKYSPDAEDIVRLKTNYRQWQGSQQISGAFPRYMAALTSCDWRLEASELYSLLLHCLPCYPAPAAATATPHTHSHWRLLHGSAYFLLGRPAEYISRGEQAEIVYIRIYQISIK